MAFFDALSKSLTKTGQGAMQKTKDATEVVRINREIDRMENEISILYSKIGIEYYKAHANDSNCEAAELVHEVTRLRQAIYSSKETIKRIRGIVKCPNCGAEIPNNVLFCGSCGFRMPRQDTVLCQNCGTVWPKGSLFCSKCGSKLGDEEQPKNGDAPARRLCTSCGAVIMPGTVFCASCGTPVDGNGAGSQKPTQAHERVCTYCGEKMDNDSVFCPSCGKMVSEEESKTVYAIEVNTDPPEVPQQQEAESDSVPVEEKPSVTQCSVCGTDLEDGDIFCSNCGNRVQP